MPCPKQGEVLQLCCGCALCLEVKGGAAGDSGSQGPAQGHCTCVLASSGMLGFSDLVTTVSVLIPFQNLGGQSFCLPDDISSLTFWGAIQADLMDPNQVL